MTPPFFIYGAGGHGRVVLDIARTNAVLITGIVDDHSTEENVEGVPVVKSTAFQSFQDFDFVMGIGANRTRARLFNEVSERGTPRNLIHPFTFISGLAKMGRGIAVMGGVVVNTGAVIGNNVILNTNCSVDHDCIIGPHSHICPGVHMAGAVTVGAGTMIGTGSSIIPGIRIGENCLIGAGSVVLRDVPANSKAFGNPARVVGSLPSIPEFNRDA